MGEEEIRLTKRNYGWPEDAKFLVPPEVYTYFKKGLGARGAKLRADWMTLFDKYKNEYPDLADDLYKMQHRQLPQGWDQGLAEFPADPKGMATRDSSGKVLNQVAKHLPWLLGGAADLAPSTKTHLKEESDFEANNYSGRNFHFGIREHAMGAVVNGLSLAKIRPFGAGFLIFSDYMRPAIRLSAIMEIPTIFIFTHDSIGLGEDGPTHQPIEQIPSLRAIPGLVTIRPCDANEVLEAWRYLIRMRHGPCTLILSRQKVPTLDRKKYASASGLAKGAYAIADCHGKPDLILIGTGSEVSLCLNAYERLTKEGIKCRVVSMPSWEIFERQEEAYRKQLLSPDVTARISVEQASTFGWERYVGIHGRMIGMTTFGASAPLEQLLKKFGFTVDNIITTAKELLHVVSK